MCACVCVREFMRVMCVRARFCVCDVCDVCVYVCVCARARACVCVCVCVCEHEYQEQVICVRLVFRRSTATTVSVLFQF